MSHKFGWCLLAFGCGGSAWAQNGMEPVTMEKWKGATEVRWQASGVYQGREKVVFGDYPGKGDVRDTLVVEFTARKKPKAEVVDVKITEGKTSVTNVKSDDTDCGPPVLKGSYEHWGNAQVRRAMSGQILLDAVRMYPAASVSQYPAGCGMMSIPGGTEPTKSVSVGVPDATILAGPLKFQAGKMSGVVAGDRRSFTITVGNGWVWTYVPTKVK